MRILINFINLLTLCSFCSGNEYFSAIEELRGLSSNDGILIREVKNLLEDMTKAVEITKT